MDTMESSRTRWQRNRSLRYFHQIYFIRSLTIKKKTNRKKKKKIPKKNTTRLRNNIKITFPIKKKPLVTESSQADSSQLEPFIIICGAILAPTNSGIVVLSKQLCKLFLTLVLRFRQVFFSFQAVPSKIYG